MVHYLWQNVVGVPCAKLINKIRYYKSETDNESQVRACSLGVALTPSAIDKVCSGLNYPNPYADVKLIPDRASYRVCPWNNKIGMTFVRMENMDGTPFDLCSRTILQKACSEMKRLYGYELRTGIEIEFNLFKNDS